jgi:hypothetical protein
MARIDEDVTGEGINVVVIAVDVPAEAVPIYQRELSAGVIDAIMAGVKSWNPVHPAPAVSGSDVLLSTVQSQKFPAVAAAIIAPLG